MRIPGCVAIENDPACAKNGALATDFFAYPVTHQFDSIVANLPYVGFGEIAPETKNMLSLELFDRRANLYLFYIEKCLRHLKMGGELILLTPRNFVKATSAAKLNELLFESGTITHFLDFGDTNIFNDESTSNSAIWRFEKGSYSRKTVTLDGERSFTCSGGQLHFLSAQSSRVRLGDVFAVKVGAISGADEIFTSDVFGTSDFVCSHTAATGTTRRMIWAPEAPVTHLAQYKDQLLARRVSRFSEKNWWHWGRSDFISDKPRIYVNSKTRNKTPFFVHPCNRYDSSVFALFPTQPDADVRLLTSLLNKVNWLSLGFVREGRFLFSQKSLEEVYLPAEFANYK